MKENTRATVPFRVKPLSQTDGYVYVFRGGLNAAIIGYIAEAMNINPKRVVFRTGPAGESKVQLAEGGFRVAYDILPEAP